jgi:hypothetical protein
MFSILSLVLVPEHPEFSTYFKVRFESKETIQIES